MAKKTSSTTKGVSKKKASTKRQTTHQMAKSSGADKSARAKPKTRMQHNPLVTRSHQFVPPPKHSAKWWERQDTVFAGGPIATVPVPGLISTKTYLLRVVAEVGPGADGSFCVFFPTIADCLLWFRWQAIPRDKFTLGEGEYTPKEIAENSKFNAALAKRIDKAKPNTDAYKLFKTLESSLLCLLQDRQLCGLYSIHEYLTELGSLTAWRRALQSDQITCDQGLWTMPRKAWSRLEEVLEPCITGECNSIDPSTVYVDEEHSVFEQLGGGEEVSKRHNCFRLHDGRVVRMLCATSETPDLCYSFRMTPQSLKQAERLGCTHLGFIMGYEGFAVVPMDLVQKYIAVQKISQGKNAPVQPGEVDIAITPAPAVTLKAQRGIPDVKIAEFYHTRE